MVRYLAWRVMASLPAVAGLVTLVFFLVHLVPGDPVALMLGDSAQEADLDNIRATLGLDRPLHEQYLGFWRSLAQGTWGQSISRQAPVFGLIAERFPASLLLAVTSLLVAIVVSVPLGAVAAVHRGSWIDLGSTSLALIGMSLPVFVVGPIAVLVFSIELRWLPVAGAGTWAHLVLPSLCLGLGLSGILTRMVRSSVLENLGEDWVRTARAKGLRETAVLGTHVLRNSLIPVITVLGNMLGGLLAGAVVTETLFDWPGMGKLFFAAFQSRDFPLIQGVVLWVALSYLVVNLVIDVLCSLIDPRIRLWGGETS